MNVDYDQIAKAYDHHRRAGGPYMETLCGLLKRCPGRRVLELGAGTGNSTEALLEAVPCTLTALELSPGMLEQAKRKRIPARWVRGSATALPFANQAFHFVYATYMLHFIHDLDLLMHECWRVLEEGCAAFTTAPTSFIENHPLNRYFPSFAQTDLARFQSIERVKEAFCSAGFTQICHEQKHKAPDPIDAAYVRKVEGKFLSTFNLLPSGEFERGLKELRADVESGKCRGMHVIWETVTIWGYKHA
ncbi:MAG TPA: methyltransferase domain-containing protein [Candidatus Hydrogenedentes bacterium]|nr:methyltransferase domain-containing protein [Candidatus Hydrogenedentota bacterium]